MNYIKKRKMAFGFAFEGLWQSLKREAHLKIHFSAAILVVAAGLFINLSKLEWVAIAICIALVLMAELFNTAVEKICDLVQPELDPRIKYIKDLAAAAVLMACLAALITGLLIFWPYVYQTFTF